MRVSLDLEEVLADTITESCNSTDKLHKSDFSSWDLDKSGHTWQVYSGVSDALWRHDPLSIPPVEENLEKTTSELYESVDTLDIVTARMHVDDHIDHWLRYHGIPYDNIVSTDRPKYELDYDLFIDDNPDMVGNCRLLLRDYPHNTQIGASRLKATTRINSLISALAFV